MTRNLGYKPSKFVLPFKVGLSCLVICFVVNFQPAEADTFSPEKVDSISFSSYIIQDKWLGSDKLAHLMLSLFISGISYEIYHDNYYNDKDASILFSSVFTFSLGLGKEFYDKSKPDNKFSYKDLVADIVGISIGLVLATNY